DWRAIAERMADDSILPDWDYRREDPPSAAWHYINLCLQDTESEIPARCVRGQCATAKIGEFTKRLSSGNYDRWGAEADLPFWFTSSAISISRSTPRPTPISAAIACGSARSGSRRCISRGMTRWYGW